MIIGIILADESRTVDVCLNIITGGDAKENSQMCY